MYMELRGNTSAGLSKRPTAWSSTAVMNCAMLARRTVASLLPAQRVSGPAYLRQHLCFWFLRQIGVPAPATTVRVQMNGAFINSPFTAM
jgi:hypothetical protein